MNGISQPHNLSADSESVKPPATVLFRYRPLDNEDHWSWLKDILVERKLYYTSPSSFNDPFDCKVRLDFDAPVERMMAFYKEDYLMRVVGLTEEAAERETRRFFRSPGWEADFKKRERELVSDFEKWRARIGVLCLSEVRNEILLWSHYASGHKGVCLEFKLRPSPFQGPQDLEFFTGAMKIGYQDALPILNLYTSTKRERLDACLLTKSKLWSYEWEKRLIDLDGDGEKAFPARVLTGVILGAQMLDEQKRRVTEWAKSGPSRVVIYRAHLSESSYAVEIERLSSPGRM